MASFDNISKKTFKYALDFFFILSCGNVLQKFNFYSKYLCPLLPPLQLMAQQVS